jgi:hypothetical protein
MDASAIKTDEDEALCYARLEFEAKFNSTSRESADQYGWLHQFHPGGDTSQNGIILRSLLVAERIVEGSIAGWHRGPEASLEEERIPALYSPLPLRS